MVKIRLTKDIFGEARVERRRLTGIFGPKQIQAEGLSDKEIYAKIKYACERLPLKNIAQKKKRIVIVTDDITRTTPLPRLLFPLLEILGEAGIERERIIMLIALGTHRKMTREEIEGKFGGFIASSYRIENHNWDNPDSLYSLGYFDNNYEIVLNRFVQAADLIISIGSIIPHATTGFSGGGKTIVPGICGEKTIESTHWKALDFTMNEILGVYSNPIRNMIDQICRKIGLDMIINTILINGDTIYDLVAGDPINAFQKGVPLCREVYEVKIPEKADIVIAEAYPMDIDLRQAIKAVCSADLVCNDGGIMILPAECPEGIAPQFPDFIRYGFKDPEGLFLEVEQGRCKQKLLAYSLVAVGRILSKRHKAILVSPNITLKQAESLGFLWAPDMQNALDKASFSLGKNSRVVVLKQASEILPKISSEDQNVRT